MQNQFLKDETAAEMTPHVTPYVTAQPLETTEIQTTETLPDVQAVNAMLALAQRTIRRRKRRYWAGFIVLELAFLFPSLLLFLNRSWGNNYIVFHFGSFIFPPILLAFVFFVAMMVTMLLPAKFEVDVLTNLNKVADIPTLIDTCVLNYKAILPALTRILPQMQASDATLLTDHHRQILNTWLKNASSAALFNPVGHDLVIAILKAYEQAGDAKAIPVVKRLADRRPHNARQRKIQQAARECLPLLRANAGSVDVTQTLLRASLPDTRAPDSLLRPANADTATAEAELLRTAFPADSPSNSSNAPG